MSEGEQGSALRFAVLCDSDEIEQWQLAALERVVSQNAAECVAILIRQGAVRMAPARKKISRYTLYNLYFRRVAKRSAAKRLASITKAFPHARVIEVETQNGPKGRTVIGDASLASIASERLDFAVRFGFGILSGPMLALPRFGVWSFHHGNPAEFRGQPPGVWEIIKAAPTTGVIVQKLNETLDGGQVLAFARFPTIASSYTRQLDHILAGSAPLLTSAALHCAAHGTLPRIELGQLGPIFKKPTTGPALQLFARMLASKVTGFFGSLFRHQQWAVFVARKPIEDLVGGGFGQDPILAFPQRHEIPEERGLFNADPFARTAPDGSLRLYFERFDWMAGKGHIAACSMSSHGSFSQTETLLRTPGHLSYPFLLEDGASPSLLPESVEDGVLKRYAMASEGHGISAEDTLGTAVLDPTVIFHAGKYWMFYCGDDRNTALHIRHADRLEGPWLEHRANPVKMDVIGARPAGPVIAHGSDLIRPGQICVPRYGHGILFNRIVTLNENEYAEEPIASLVPAGAGRYRNGVHTVGVAGDWLVLDHARTIFSAAEAWRVLWAKLSRFLVLKRA